MANAQEIASAGVYATDDVGIEITDGSNVRAQLGKLGSGSYGLKVISSNGTTVIIDGTSGVFLVGASGTITISSGPANGSAVTAFVDNIQPDSGSWPSGTVASIWYTSGEILPYLTFTLANGTMAQMQEGFVSGGTQSGTVKATFRWSSFNAGVGGSAASVRYFLFTEVTV